MYDWIIVADIYRLEKAIREIERREERGPLILLLEEKRGQLRGRRPAVAA